MSEKAKRQPKKPNQKHPPEFPKLKLADRIELVAAYGVVIKAIEDALATSRYIMESLYGPKWNEAWRDNLDGHELIKLSSGEILTSGEVSAIGSAGTMAAHDLKAGKDKMAFVMNLIARMGKAQPSPSPVAPVQGATSNERDGSNTKGDTPSTPQDSGMDGTGSPA